MLHAESSIEIALFQDSPFLNYFIYMREKYEKERKSLGMTEACIETLGIE